MLLLAFVRYMCPDDEVAGLPPTPAAVFGGVRSVLLKSGWDCRGNDVANGAWIVSNLEACAAKCYNASGGVFVFCDETCGWGGVTNPPGTCFCKTSVRMAGACGAWLLQHRCSVVTAAALTSLRVPCLASTLQAAKPTNPASPSVSTRQLRPFVLA